MYAAQIEFLNHLQYHKRCSEHTLTAYRTDLKQFTHYLVHTYGEEVNLSNLKVSFIRSWLVELTQKNISPKSIARKHSTLKSFFKFCLKKNYVERNPMLKVQRPKSRKRLPIVVKEKELRHLLERTEFANDFSGQRDYLILELLYTTGIRRAELINLKLSAIDFNNNQLKVLGKGNKERILPFGIQLRQTLFNYLEKREDLDLQEQPSQLLLTDKGKPLYPKMVYNLVNKYLAMVSTVSKRSPHVLRHSFATHLADNGADINAIKELLGHTSLAATQVYTHSSIEKLKETYKQAHPKALKK